MKQEPWIVHSWRDKYGNDEYKDETVVRSAIKQS